MSRTSLRRGLAVVAGLALSGSALVALPSSALASSPPTPSISSVSPNTGKVAGGLTVTVNGSNFSHVSKVEFGTTSGTKVHIVSTHRLTVVSPKHVAGVQNVRVVTKLGSTSKTSAVRTADHFSYANPPAITSVTPTAGPTVGANAVTINGSGFTKISRVTFATLTAAHLKVVSSTRITVTAPAHPAGLADIHVYGTYGTSVTTTHDHYTYAIPTITSIAAKAGDPAGGNIITISGTSFSGANKVVFGTTAAHIDTESTTKLTVTVPAHAVGSVDVRVTGTYGTSAVTSKDRYTYAPKFSQVSLASAFDATGVSCVSATVCLAVGDGGAAVSPQWTKYNGSAWTTPAALPGLLDVETVTCLTASDCIALGLKSAAGAYGSETFTGSTWGAATTLPSALNDAELFGFSCASASMCLVVASDEDSDPIAAKYNGSSWTQTADPGILPFAVSCYAPSTCVASGIEEDPADPQDPNPESATYNGSTWSAEIDAPFIVNSISCVSSAFCLAVGFDIATGDQLYATFGSGAWSNFSPLPDAMPIPADVTCLSSTWCTALGEGEIIGSETSNFNGVDWSDPTLIQGYGGESGGGVISCPTTTFCVGELGDGALVLDNGSWADSAVFPGFPTDVSCSSASFCLATDDFGTAQSFDGQSWTTVPAEPGVGYLDSVSCISSTDCVAVGTSINGAHAQVWDGAEWTNSVDITGMSYGSAVTCVAASDCLAIGGSALSSSDTDTAVSSHFTGTWTSATAMDAGDGLESPEFVSCSSSTVCAAIGLAPDDAGFMPAVLANGAWTSDSSLESDNYTVSCAPGVNWCMAVDFFSGGTLTTTGGAWAPGTGPATSNASAGSISCSAMNMCVLGGDDGTPEAWLRTGTTWSDAIAVSTTAGNSVGTLSCFDTSFCAVIAGEDDLATDDLATGRASDLLPAGMHVADRLVTARRAASGNVAVARRTR